MNTPIVRLYAFILLLFAALVGFTSYWAVFDSTTLKEETAEPPPADRGAAVKRGSIKTADGVTVAESHPGRRRRPPGLRAQLSAGLAVREPGRLQLRQRRPDRDRAFGERRPGGRAQRVHARSSTSSAAIPQEGDNVTLTINSHAQQVATQALQNAIASTPGSSGAGGAVVALDPSTGAVEAMASVPGYDPNQVKNTSAYQAARTLTSRRPIVNRATQSTYPPGLDDEGRHRRRRARLGQVHPDQRPQRSLAADRSAACRCRTPAASSSATST